jgi:hypothetical protein
MTWFVKVKKDVATCDKFRRAGSKLWTGNFRMRLRIRSERTSNAVNGNVLVTAGREINWDIVSKSDWKQSRANWIPAEMCGRCGVLRLPFSPNQNSWSCLERHTIQGDSPVDKILEDVVVSWVLLVGYLAGIWVALTSNSKYSTRPIAYEYSDGKLKRTPNRELKDSETKWL